MKSRNRLTNQWTPAWELGLQDEFCFSLDLCTEQIESAEEKRSDALSAFPNGRIDRETEPRSESKAELLYFLEALKVELVG